MDEKEAIERLTDHFRIHYDGRPTPYLDKAVAIAMNALHKQIPKKPINKTKLDDAASLAYENCNIVVCPTCDRRLKLKSKGKYCDKCGQKLDWGRRR